MRVEKKTKLLPIEFIDTTVKHVTAGASVLFLTIYGRPFLHTINVSYKSLAKTKMFIHTSYLFPNVYQK